MSDQYMKEILRVAVAQICQTIGYNATQTAPLELLQDVLDKFMKEFTRDLRRQVEHYNRTDANLNDVTLTLRSINVNLNELLDYINNVEPVPFALEVPKFPARKDSALNFLKPGSKEVLTRPVHVHDYLPPMLPPEITQPSDAPLGINTTSLTDPKIYPENTNTEFINNDSTNKTASNVLNKTTLQSLFKPSTHYEDGERPTREVSSVVMTSGGYISPAVEGKMPEAKVPDIIDKLLGLDAPPPPTPPPLPPPPPPPVARPPSRATNLTSTGTVDISKSAIEKDVSDRDREVTPSAIKEAKKSLARNLEPQPISNKKLDSLHEFQTKKGKLYNAAAKGYPHDPHTQPVGNYNKKSFIMHQNAANMLLKKAKKQKTPLIPGQAGINEKHAKPLNDKIGKMDAADKAHRKYMKMLQKMAKQGKIPPELLSNIMGPDKKSKIINPAIVASMPPGPEKLQLEKLLRKQAKQRQKLLKQQMMVEVQKQSKKPLQQQPPPLIPIFPPKSVDSLLSKPLTLDFEENKIKAENRDNTSLSPVKSPFVPNALSSMPLAQADVSLAKGTKTPSLNETLPVNILDVTAKSLTTKDGKELKLSNEPDRTKLNIFKKISKQKTPKSSSPTPIRGLSDTPIINLPSGTTITPAPGPSNSVNPTTALTATPLGRHLFPDNNIGGIGGAGNNLLMNADALKDNKLAAPPQNPNQPTDLSMLNRVFGEKPPEVELVNKPKKRGRKPGSKNSPKIPGVFPNNLLKKNSKKMKLDNSNIFSPQMPPQLPPEFAAAANMGNLSFENVAQLFGNPLNSMDWAKNKHLQHQMMIMATAKERKEHKRKAKLPKQDNLNSDKIMPNIANMTNPHMTGPTNEEVQSINKKLMRMDTILKAAPSAAPSDLTIDTSLISGKKLASPSMFPSSTSPLKSPGNTKRMMTAGAEAMANSLVQPFMLPNRPAFPNLPTNMLSMLQFPFPTRPGLIPTPGLFPTPGLGAFPNNPKNPLLPGLFPFPNLKHTMGDNSALNQESENLTTDKKKIEMNLQAAERSYCNVAPLVPDFLTKLNEQTSSNISSNKHSHDPPHPYEADLPKTPKPRNSHSGTLSQDNLIKKMSDAHTPESVAGSLSGKSIPTTPGGMSLNTFEQLMKKCDSPIDLMSLNKHTKSLTGSQELGLDFSMNKKSNINTNIGSITGGLSIKTPITLNNEPIEVSDDSDETNQPQQLPLPLEKKPIHLPSTNAPHLGSSQLPQQSAHHNNFNMDDMFVANTVPNLVPKPLETELSNKELKKHKKQVKKSALPNINTNLIKTDKPECLTTAPASATGVGKLAGGADLIPLTSTGLAYSAKNIPYNSLTANANLSFHSHKTDFSNTTVPTSAGPVAPSSSSVFDNLTITAAIPMTSSSANTVYDLQKKRKEHKKLKKLKELKEGKIKKKKDKKDKSKSKEKGEKYLLGQAQISPTKERDKEKEHIALNKESTAVVAPILSSHSSGGSGAEKVKDKDLLKKLKKEKKKEKQRTNLEEHTPQSSKVIAAQQSTVSSNAPAHKERTPLPSASSTNTFESELPKKQKLSPAVPFTGPTANEHYENALTINTTPVTAAASIVPKLTLKLGSTHSPTPPRDDSHKTGNTTALPSSAVTAAPVQAPQAPITPPREREPSPELARISPLVTRPPKHKLNTSGDLATSSSNATNTISAANASSLEIGDSIKNNSTPNSNMIVPPPSPWLSGGTISASSVLLPHQLLQTSKQHDMTATPNSSGHNTDTNTKNQAPTDRQSPLTLITETSRPSSYIDAEGNRVWICPACGKVDDGSPMIGCDGCDAWYHWVCVGIFVAPKDNEDWFCRVCITRKKGLHGSDKKRKRNKKK